MPILLFFTKAEVQRTTWIFWPQVFPTEFRYHVQSGLQVLSEFGKRSAMGNILNTGGTHAETYTAGKPTADAPSADQRGRAGAVAGGHL